MINISAVPGAIILLVQDDLENQLPIDLDDYCNRAQGMIKNGMERKRVPMFVVRELVIHIVRHNPYIEWFDKKPDGKYKIRWKPQVIKKDKKPPRPKKKTSFTYDLTQRPRVSKKTRVNAPILCPLETDGGHYLIHLPHDQYLKLIGSDYERQNLELGDQRYTESLGCEIELRGRSDKRGDQAAYGHHGQRQRRDFFYPGGSYP